jgi:hypothetical protein
MTVWPALGTTLKVDKTGGTSPTTQVGQILSIDGPSSEVGSVETTNLSSTWKQYRPTLPDGGEVSMEIEYDPTDTGTGSSHGFLKTIAGTPAKYTWVVTYPTTPACTDTFVAFLTKLGRSAGGAEENLTSSFTLKIDGTVA